MPRLHYRPEVEGSRVVSNDRSAQSLHDHRLQTCEASV
jgi:hypothetical protein